MSRKQKKQQRSKESDQQQGNSSANRDKQKKQQYFQCQCGKKYGSLAAVHTHINNKHPQQKKKYKLAIKNPKKNGQGPATSIRMKDIQYHQKQAQLMCTSDTTLKDIFQYITNEDERRKTKTIFMLSDENIDSCDDLDEDQENYDYAKSKRDREIRQRVDILKEKYQLTYLEDILRDIWELEVVRLNRFNLQLIREIVKYFNLDFATKLHLSLQMILARKRGIPIEEKDRYKGILQDLWQDLQPIMHILQNYVQQWNRKRTEQRQVHR